MKFFNYLVTLFFLFIGLASKAQEPTIVKEQEEIIQEISGNALYVNIYKATSKSILKNLKSALKDKSEEVKVKGDNLYAKKVSFPSISDSLLSIYGYVKELSNETHHLYLLFIDQGTAISSVNDLSGYTAARSFLYDFANTISKETSEEHYSNELKALEKMEKELKELKRKKEKEEKNIDKLKKQIKKSELIIDKLDRKDTLEEQDIKERAKNETIIITNTKNIKENEYDIVSNKKQQEELKEKITNQKELVKHSKNTMDAFK